MVFLVSFDDFLTKFVMWYSLLGSLCCTCDIKVFGVGVPCILKIRLSTGLFVNLHVPVIVITRRRHKRPRAMIFGQTPEDMSVPLSPELFQMMYLYYFRQFLHRNYVSLLFSFDLSINNIHGYSKSKLAVSTVF